MGTLTFKTDWGGAEVCPWSSMERPWNLEEVENSSQEKRNDKENPGKKAKPRTLPSQGIASERRGMAKKKVV